MVSILDIIIVSIPIAGLVFNVALIIADMRWHYEQDQRDAEIGDRN